MSDISETSPSDSGAVALLLQAIRSLPPDQQDVVLGHLLTQGRAAASGPLPGGIFPGIFPGGAVRLASSLTPDIARTVVAIEAGGRPDADLRTVPIRFQAAQYEQLKRWCQENNFPMAVVVRGLVERFLEQQQPQA